MKDLIILGLVYWVLTQKGTAAPSGNSGTISIPNLPDDGYLVISAGYGYNGVASNTAQPGWGTGITGQPGVTPPGAIS